MTTLVLLSDLVIESNDKLDQRIRSLFNSEQPSIGYIPSCSDPERKYFEHTRRYYNQVGIDNIQYYDLDSSMRRAHLALFSNVMRFIYPEEIRFIF